MLNFPVGLSIALSLMMATVFSPLILLSYYLIYVACNYNALLYYCGMLSNKILDICMGVCMYIGIQIPGFFASDLHF